MIKKCDLQKLTPSNTKLINVNYPATKTTITHEIVYEDQIPTLCFILISGKIEALKNKTVVGEVPVNSIVGLNQILKHEMVSCTFRAIEGSEIVYFDRTTLKTISNEKNNKIGDLLRSLIN